MRKSSATDVRPCPVCNQDAPSKLVRLYWPRGKGNDVTGQHRVWPKHGNSHGNKHASCEGTTLEGDIAAATGQGLKACPPKVTTGF